MGEEESRCNTCCSQKVKVHNALWCQKKFDLGETMYKLAEDSQKFLSFGGSPGDG